MVMSKVEKIAYYFGWVILGPINMSLSRMKKKKVERRPDNRLGSRKRLLVANVIGLISLLLKLDGRVTPEQVRKITGSIVKSFKLDSNVRSSLESIFCQFLKSSLSFEGLVETIPGLVGKDQKSRNLVFELLVYTVDSVSELGWEKKLLLLRLAHRMGIPFTCKKVLLDHEYSNKLDCDNCDDKLYTMFFLGLDENCSRNEIHKQYRKIVKTIHPDLYPGESTELQRARITAMQELNKLYQDLVEKI